MRVQQGITSRHNGADYAHTYVVIPSRIRREMRLSSGSIVFIAQVAARRIEILRVRRHADDFQTRLHESVTGRHRGEAYTAMRLMLPKALVGRMKIKKGTEAEFTHAGTRCFVRFEDTS